MSTGVLGARGSRLRNADARLEGVSLQLESLLSNTQDVDFSEVVLQMTRSEQTLQLAQATGARLMQQSLLNFLR